MIKLLLFAGLRELAGAATLEHPWHPGMTLRDIRQSLAAQHSKMQPLLARSQAAVNDTFSPDDTLIPERAEVAFLPPVSGG